MKKLLLSLSLLASFTTFAQQDTVLMEDCSTMTIGNLGTDLTGTTAGQNGWLTFVSSTASPVGQLSDFQVVDAAGVNGYAMQLNGTTADATGNARFIMRDLTDSWINRTSGNDIAQVEFDLYTGSATTSKNTFRTYLYNSSGQAVAGFYFVPATKIIKGWAYYDNAGTPGYYIFQLGSAADITLDADTWYRVGLAFDYNTGDVTWKESTGLFYGNVTGAAPGDDIVELDFLMTTPAAAGNSVAAQVKLDNILINFDAVESLLGVNNVASTSNKFTVFPNPAKSIVTVSNADASISAVELTDLNGRVVKNVSVSNLSDVQVSISDLAQGVYMMKITSDKGVATKKIIKE